MGAVVAGDIDIGDDVQIGPNAVVMSNVPERRDRHGAAVAGDGRARRGASRPSVEPLRETGT